MRGKIWVAGMCLLAGLGAASASAEDIAWHTDLNKAWIQARAEQRPLLMFVVRDGCTFCDQMKAKTYADAQVANEINESYVALIIDPKQRAGFAKDFKIRAYPTTLVISPQSKVLDRMKGYLPPDKFRQHLTDAEARLNATARVPSTTK